MDKIVDRLRYARIRFHQLQAAPQQLEELRQNLEATVASFEEKLEQARADADGYSCAYNAVNEAWGELAEYNLQLETAYRDISRELHRLLAASAEAAPPRDVPDFKPFLIVGNGRTGSTWLTSTLDRLPDVRCLSQMGWREPGERSIAGKVYIDPSIPSFVPLIADITLGSGVETMPPVAGSKFTFEPYWFTSPAMLANLQRMTRGQLPVIVLKRSYFEVFLSWRVRGVEHIYDLTAPHLTESDKESIIASPNYVTEPQPIVFTNRSLDLAERKGAVKYPLRRAVDDLLMLFSNDVMALQLDPAMIVDYSEIAAKLPEIVCLIGSRATVADMAAVLGHPLTQKLPRLEQYVSPRAPVERIAGILDRAFAQVSTARSPAKPCVRWDGINTLVVEVDGLADVLRDAGLEPVVDGAAIRWTIQKPMLWT